MIISINHDKKTVNRETTIFWINSNIEGMKSIVLSMFVLFTFASGSLLAQPEKAEADKIKGIWLTGNGKAKVKIYDCDGKYCGKIVWLKNPYEDDGSEKLDKENPDDKLKKRPILGLHLLTDFEYDEDLEWEDGEIYDPESGKTYSCVINMDEENPNSLDVRGYIGFSLIGRTDVWTRSKLN